MPNLHEIRFSQIHQAIRNNNTIESAASMLEVNIRTLKIYLRRLVLQYKSDFFTFEQLNKKTSDIITKETMRIVFSLNYEKPLRPKQVILEELPFSQIHAAILDLTLTTKTDFSIHLGVNSRLLNDYLMFLGLTIEELLMISAETMRSKLGIIYDSKWDHNQTIFRRPPHVLLEIFIDSLAESFRISSAPTTQDWGQDIDTYLDLLMELLEHNPALRVPDSTCLEELEKTILPPANLPSYNLNDSQANVTPPYSLIKGNSTKRPNMEQIDTQPNRLPKTNAALSKHSFFTNLTIEPSNQPTLSLRQQPNVNNPDCKM